MTRRGIVAFALFVTACSNRAAAPFTTAPAPTSAAPATTGVPATTAAAPPGDAFYTPPDPLPPGEPGRVIWTSAETDGVWRVLYHSRSIKGDDIAVSGVVVVPRRAPPAGGWPVVSWAHGTTGSADRCAPSRLGGSVTAGYAAIARAGYVVAATDYEGLGTPGPHPYLLGDSEGRGVLDAARAAAALPEAHASRTTVVIGHSQGGQAALFAGELARTYAPDLDVRGVVAIAPATDLGVLLPGAAAVPAFSGFAVAAAYGWSSAYGDAPLDTILTDDAIEKATVLERECLSGVLAAYASDPPGAVFHTSPLAVPVWKRWKSAAATSGAGPPAIIEASW